MVVADSFGGLCATQWKSRASVHFRIIWEIAEAQWRCAELVQYLSCSECRIDVSPMPLDLGTLRLPLSPPFFDLTTQSKGGLNSITPCCCCAIRWILFSEHDIPARHFAGLDRQTLPRFHLGAASERRGQVRANNTLLICNEVRSAQQEMLGSKSEMAVE